MSTTAPMIHIIYKSRIVSPKVEKPVQDKYKTTPELGGGYRVTDWLSFDDALLKYEAHLNSLSGIECSAELLERFKDGDEVVEGKDFKISRVGRCFGRYSAMVEIAIPTDAVEEGEEGEEIDLHDFLEEYGSYVLKGGWNVPADFLKDFPNYKLIKK